MKIYEKSNIQDIIRAFIEEQKSLGTPITYQELATNLRIQKSYLSKVMNKSASLSKDQAYLLTNFLKLNSQESEFFFLLLDFEKASLTGLKDMLLERIKQIQYKNTQSSKYLNKEESSLDSNQMQEYYLYPETQLVHLAFAIKRYQQNPEELKLQLGLSDEVFKNITNILIQLNLIQIKDRKIELVKSNLHLSPNSPFFQQWHTQLKLKSIEWSKKLDKKDKYNFTASFTASNSDKEKIHIEYLSFLNKVEGIVSKSKSKNLYQINFDLFKWL